MPEEQTGPENKPEILFARKSGTEKSRKDYEHGAKVRQQPFDVLNESIIRGELPEKALNERLAERRRRYQELKDMRVVDIVRNRIGRTLAQIAEWDEAPDAIEGFSGDLEEEISRMEGNKYSEKPYLHGMVQAMTLGAAKYIALQGFENIIDDEDALKRNNMTRGAVERLREQVGREHFMDFGYDPFQKLNDSVAARRTKEERDKDYWDVRRGDGAGAGDAEREIQRKILAATEDTRDAALISAEEQRKYLEAIQQGYDGFVSTEYNRASFDPKTFHIQPPFWYGELSAREKKTIVTRTNITNLAAHIETYGMTHFDEVMGALGFRIEKEGLANMWDEMPGFRIAMATMVDDIFEKEGEDHFVISDQGYDIIKEFTQYKETVIDAMEKHLRENPHPKIDRYYLKKDKRKDKYREAAIAAVSAVDNLLYAGGAYFSGDEERKVRNTKIWQEQPRAFSTPGIKGIAKWIKGENVDDLPTGREEDWGGILGDHMQRRSSADGEFKRDFAEGTGRRYMPRRLFFSMFDHVYYKKRYSKEAFYDTRTISIGKHPDKRGRVVDRDEATFAEALIYCRKKDVDNGDFQITLTNEETGEKSKLNLTLKDYEKPEQMGITQLKPDDLHGYYADVRSHAVPIYKHLTATDLRSNALTSSGFIKELNKLRHENPQLAGQATPDGQKWLLWDPNLFEGALAISALKEASDRRIDTGVGFENVSELLLTIPDNIYDNVITNVLNEPRLYYSMPSNFREYLFKAFHANDTHSMSQAILAPTRSTPLSERQGLRRQAAENTARRLRQR